MLGRMVFTLAIVLAFGLLGRADEPTFEQLAEAKRIQRDVEQAAKLLESAEAHTSAAYWLQAHQRIEAFLVAADPVQRKLMLEPVQRLGELRSKLVDSGATLPAIPEVIAADVVAAPASPTKSASPPAVSSSNTTEFAASIAPILLDKCGRCHVEASRGKLNFGTVETLAGNPKLLVPGKPEESELFTVIESGEMPKGNRKVAAEELDRLRQWIQAGADFGNVDRSAKLSQIAAASRSVATATTPAASIPPAEGEIVSFTNHVAQIFLDNCADCHMNGQRVRGGLNLSTMESMLRGGDNGSIIRANQGEESLLVKKLRGTGGGQQMPAGSAPLNEEVIKTIVRWIDQGAKFDGGNPNADLRDLVARAASAKATHEELTKQRAARALANWMLVMNGKNPATFESENFIVLANDEDGKLKEFAETAESVASRVASQLKIPPKDPLLKGKIAAYLFAVRYDYAEFGKMIEKRELPRHWVNHWGNNQVDAYVVFQTAPGDYDSLKPWIARNITAAYVKGLAADVPDWFANGMAYSVAARTNSNNDTVKLWRQKAEELKQKMANAADFVSGQMSEDDAGLVASLFVEYLKTNGGNRVNKVINEMREGTSFERAFVLAFEMTPAEMLNTPQ